MQKKKIFIEIPIPAQVKKRLERYATKWADLPVKWLKEESLHITVTFVGYVDESVLPDICEKVCEAGGEIESFDLMFNEIIMSPDVTHPHMVAVVGEANDNLRQLNQLIEEALGINKHEHKQFRPHITLGRIRKLKWDELEVKPVIAEKINIIVSVDAVEIMESKGGGAEYISLEQCPLS